MQKNEEEILTFGPFVGLLILTACIYGAVNVYAYKAKHGELYEDNIQIIEMETRNAID